MPLDTLFSNPLPVLPRPRAVLSRFTAPLANRSRNIADFYIEPEDPWKPYHPGDTVKGHVNLTVAKGCDITHLVVCLHGYAKVYKTHVIPGETTSISCVLDTPKGTKGVEHLGNGLVSLFQDEIVLCGNGFLKKQIYKFEFELEFPARNLPSSIDFERGTVSYYITATLTRPTTIAPTLTCFRRLMFQDSVDVAHIAPPKPRVISLEPIAKRGALVKSVASAASHSEIQPPHSPAPSDATGASGRTNSTLSLQLVNHTQSVGGITQRNSSDAQSSVTSTSHQTITATTELLKQAALPGDTIPIKLSVTHIKGNVRGLVIVTLYRQGRIDFQPTAPLNSKGKGKQSDSDEIYTRSKTGLGGLYFTNSPPSSTFRKDLSQTSTMMIVNPLTLQAELNTSIRVPHNSFPSMTNVPGGMITFRYYVEIVVDLCGKLGEARFLPRLTSEPSYSDGSTPANTHQSYSELGHNILDTAQLRRTKSVVDFTLLVVIGSSDSSRRLKKTVEDLLSQEPLELGPQQTTGHQRDQQDAYSNEEDEYYDERQDNPGNYEVGPNTGWDPPVPPHTQLIPPPLPEEAVDEKTRLRRQEELLLPSQPPIQGSPSSATGDLAASAPFIPEGANFNDFRDGQNGVVTLNTQRILPSVVSTRSGDTIIAGTSTPHPPPTFEEDPGDGMPLDKQELERQRLLAQASSPPTESATNEESVSHDDGHAFVPTARILPENYEYNAYTLHDLGRDMEHLPRYQR